MSLHVIEGGRFQQRAEDAEEACRILRDDNIKLRDAIASQGIALRQRAPKPPTPWLNYAIIGTACLAIGYVLGGA